MDINLFIEKSDKIHNHKYDYSLVYYKNNKTKINIICQFHGIFNQRPDLHLRGSGCPSCSNENLANKLRKNINTFIEKSNLIHNFKYDYSKSIYLNNRTDIEIICPTHGTFYQTPKNHINNHGCPQCGTTITRSKTSLSIDDFIKRCSLSYNNFYDYSKVDYKNNKQKVIIICPNHGEFLMSPSHHFFLKHGCKKCSNTYRRTNLEFIEQCKIIHGNFYNYDNTIFHSLSKKVKIICTKHGEFIQTAYHHLKGHGCPSCNSSKGEKIIKDFLIINNLKFKQEFKFNDCLSEIGFKLKFDFYLQNENIIIEFDGKQHFEPIEFFGGDKSLKILQRNDEIKNQYCIDNNMTIIRIKYSNNIESIKEILTQKIINKSMK